jgi:hypothetical protein
MGVAPFAMKLAGAPADQRIVEFLLARCNAGEIAARQEGIDRKCHHRQFRRQAQAGDGVPDDAKEVGAPQQHGRNIQAFELRRCAAERGRARPAGGVSYDHAVDAAVLDLLNRRISTDGMLTLRKPVDGEHLDPGKSASIMALSIGNVR